MRRAIARRAALLLTMLGAVSVLAGCVETTRRTAPSGIEQQVDEASAARTPRAGSTAGHGSRAPRGGAIVVLPDLGDDAAPHRSGVTFPEQVGPFRRVRVLRRGSA